MYIQCFGQEMTLCKNLVGGITIKTYKTPCDIQVPTIYFFYVGKPFWMFPKKIARSPKPLLSPLDHVNIMKITVGFPMKVQFGSPKKSPFTIRQANRRRICRTSSTPRCCGGQQSHLHERKPWRSFRKSLSVLGWTQKAEWIWSRDEVFNIQQRKSDKSIYKP